MELGFVGLGAMGAPMVRRLLAAGHVVHVWARRAESAAGLVADGALFCASPAEVAARSAVSFSIVTRDVDVEAVLAGPNGMVEGMAAGHLHVIMSTTAPETARQMGALLARRGARLIDAPVSGGPTAAAAGTLAIMAGGAAADLEAARPLLSVLGQRLVHVGALGAGQVAKACNQMVMVAAIEAVAEALALAERAGLDLERVRQAVAGGAGGSRVIDVFGPRMVAGDYADGIESRLHHKDFGIVLATAHRMNLALPLAATVAGRLNALQAQGGEKQDTASLFGLFGVAAG